MKKIIIFPFNGNGIEALDCIVDQYELIGFADDTREKEGKNKLGFEVFSRSIISKYPEAYVLAVPGSTQSFKIRSQIIDGLSINEERFAKVIHPSASVSKLSHIGYNTLIMAGVVVTSNSIIGNHVCILPNTVIHHDSTIGDYTLIGAGVTIAGNTDVEENCYIGAGSRIINGIKIGRKTLVGMSTNVLQSLSNNVKAVGNPARLIP